FVSYYLLALVALALTYMTFLVFIDLCDVPCRPTPMLSTVHPDVLRRRNLPGSLPSEQCHPMDSDAPCRFFRRIGFHLCYTSITYVCQAQNQRNDAGTECPACTAKKSISI